MYSDKFEWKRLKNLFNRSNNVKCKRRIKIFFGV